MKRRLPAAAALAVAAVAAWAAVAADDFPWLDTLDAGDGVMASGKRLMDLPMGLHRLDRGATAAELVTVGAHGWGSRGYEWVYLLKSAGDQGGSVWFHRWDFNGCPGAAAEELVARLTADEFAVAERIRLLGHSYGGLVVVDAARRWGGAVSLDAHAIAAPLAGAGERCNYRPPAALPANVALHQWRTRHDLDGAFRDMPVDPQAVEIPGSAVTLLPETYNGRRLGHNWSVSWVADTLAGRSPAP